MGKEAEPKNNRQLDNPIQIYTIVMELPYDKGNEVVQHCIDMNISLCPELIIAPMLRENQDGSISSTPNIVLITAQSENKISELETRLPEEARVLKGIPIKDLPVHNPEDTKPVDVDFYRTNIN